MADFDSDDAFSPLGDELSTEFHAELGRNSTNILNLDEGDMSAPETGYAEDGMAEDGSYPVFEDAGTMSDDDEPGQELSPGGVLDEETIGQGLTNLGRSAEGSHLVYLHCSLPGFSLNDISLLKEYIHLQKIELPYNELTDLSALGDMPYLLELDVSHNKLTNLLDFTPPKNLRKVDVSFNDIDDMGDLSGHECLVNLNLDNNQIKEIKGLSKCRYLEQLSLGHNNIEKIQGLDDLPLCYLNLRSNQIKKIENLEKLKYLQICNFSGNKIRSMNGLQKHDLLEHVDLEDNEIIDLSEIQYVKELHLLRELNLRMNPIQELPDYRLSILYHLQCLTELDRRRVDVEEKVAALNMFAPPLEVIAARDHIMHVVYSFLQPSKVLDSTLPSIETPYPMLVLAGPQGAGKKDLSLKLVEEFPDYFGYGVSHTTRKPHAEETPGKDYHFVSIDEFERDVKLGKFIQTYQYHGNLYGLTIDAIESVAREGLACVVHMELEGVLTLKNTYFEPRYVMIMPLNKDAHERRLRDRGWYSEPQIEWTINRGELYSQYHRDHPGFFDMMINSEDITDAYRKLRRTVMDYLGISEPTPAQSETMEPSSSGSPLLDREATDTITGNSHNLGPRTWSKPSIPDSVSQVYAAVKSKMQSPLPTTGRGVVEEESLKRRQSAAKEAVAGRAPALYPQIKQPKTAPEDVSYQLGLGDEEMAYRSFSAPPANKENMDALPPSSPDSSIPSDGHSSSLSNISDARRIEDEAEGSPTARSPRAAINLPTETIERIELMSGSGSKTASASGQPPLAPRPGSGSRPGSGMSEGHRSGRPGSERHPVLPPITSPPPANPLPQY